MPDAPPRGSFYAKECACPFCSTVFKGWRLYPTVRVKVERLDDYFDVPYYESDGPGAPFCDFLCHEVRVCPGCAYASNEETQFAIERGTPTWKPEKEVGQAVRTAAADRKRLAAQAADLQVFPRSPADALVGFTVAIHASLTLFKASARTHAIETVRAGNYALKAAILSTKVGRTERVEPWRRAAFDYLRRAFEADVTGPASYRATYQLGALAIWFGEDSTASHAFEQLRGLRQRDSSRELNRYLERLRTIWQDRDLHRAPTG